MQVLRVEKVVQNASARIEARVERIQLGDKYTFSLVGCVPHSLYNCSNAEFYFTAPIGGILYLVFLFLITFAIFFSILVPYSIPFHFLPCPLLFTPINPMFIIINYYSIIYLSTCFSILQCQVLILEFVLVVSLSLLPTRTLITRVHFIYKYSH